ncbi:Gfo/Idh/MocA family protein [Alicyclobacillus sp. SO9]|uniref:Gfo/Idh/MocA family protein n=1 Tax=Alicyclobacillus sp. SO9 TaxID=2665646 RepID=UPI0018E758E6|nr:Gfo/Idh/MocA family oxidoreductase [Alicyclobacillus sp. SO9]QQE79155.1 Gfo/Idh/MocA family oxidoreductase [Alicyclobacillus sp. SO9]
MSKLRVAVIGCGSIAKHRHIPEYASNPAVQLVAFCDVVLERAQRYAKEYGAAAYGSYEELLAKESVEAVSVCLPNYLHAPVSIAAANAGAHVLCEKPMATSVAEAQSMIQAAKDNNVSLMIGHNQRLMPPHVKAKEILQQGYLGKVVSFRTAFGHPGPEGWSIDGKDSWFFDKDRAFIGAMGDLGVHKTDLIRYLLNEEIVEVGAFVDTLVKENTNVDDNAVCIARTASGTVGTLAASWSYQKEDNSTVLYCENGVMRINDDPVNQVIAHLSNGTVEKYEVGAAATNEKQTNSGVIDAFVSGLQAHTQPEIPGEEGLKSLNVVLAMIEASEKKRMVEVRL